MVVILHFNNNGANTGIVNMPELLTTRLTWGFLVESFCIVAVNCFVLITGYFLSTAKLTIKKIGYLYLQVLMYSVGVYLVLCLLPIASVGFSATQLIKCMFPMLSNQYWFFKYYCLLYLISPLLNLLIAAMDKQMYRSTNLLKSSHGCFYEFLGVRAYQVSSPIQIRMTSDQFYVQNSKTHLTFDDKWPNDVTNYELADRTNGFLSLQKLNNNAPSIDMGNGNTVVNFRGGQVELQNAQNVSDKYKTTLAISYRSGIMATGGVEIQMAHGLGTDAATLGTVNFYDGTVSPF